MADDFSTTKIIVKDKRVDGQSPRMPRPLNRIRRGLVVVAAILAVPITLLLGRRPRRENEYYPELAPAMSDPKVRFNATRVFQNFALQDWLVLAYLTLMLLGVTMGGGSTQTAATKMLLADFSVVFVGLFVVRAELLGSTFGSQLLYRLVLLVAPLASFLQFAYILPTAAGRAIDAKLYALDLYLFGFEPALAWDQFATQTWVEWFSFFYYSYFFIVALHVFPMMFRECRQGILTEFSWGILWLYCLGQVLYLLVPAYGPYRLFSGQYVHEFSGGTWWPLVKNAVNSVGGKSRLDVFPSLHTAAPTFFALFAFRHRAHVPFRYVWPILGFFASQIIIATMILRWHYLIDICGGLLMAGSALWSAKWVAMREASRQRVTGAMPAFRVLLWRCEPESVTQPQVYQTPP